MPLNANPDATVPFVLLTDRALPEADRPTFYLRYLTCLQHEQVCDLILQAAEAQNDKAFREIAQKAIDIGLKRAKGMKVDGVDKSDKSPLEYLTAKELWELVRAIESEPLLDEQKKRESASSAASSAESTATDAPPPA